MRLSWDLKKVPCSVSPVDFTVRKGREDFPVQIELVPPGRFWNGTQGSKQELCFSLTDESRNESSAWSPKPVCWNLWGCFVLLFKCIETLSCKALHGSTPSKCSIVRKNFKPPIRACFRTVLWFIGISFPKKLWAALQHYCCREHTCIINNKTLWVLSGPYACILTPENFV